MILEADFCSLELPDGWLQCGQFGFAQGIGSEALRGEVEEVLAEGESTSVGEVFKERKAFLERCFEAFEVLAEGPVEACGPGAHGLRVRYEDDDFQPIVHQEVVLAEGPVVCTVRLAGPEDVPDREVLFEHIVRTFHLTLGRSLATAEPFVLFGDEDLNLKVAEEPPRQDFPSLCYSLAPPRAWDYRAEEREVVFEGSGFELRLRRLLASEREPGPWLVQSLERMRSTRGRLLGWSRGTTSQGSFTALWIELGDGTWRTAATQRQIVLRLSTVEPLEFTLRGSLFHPTEIEELLGALLASLKPLPAEEWHTHPAEPWLDLNLEGPWTCNHPGLYHHPEFFLPVLELRRQDNTQSLDTLEPSLHEALRQGAGVLPGTDVEQTERGTFYGRQAWRYRADAQLSVRGLWIFESTVLTFCLVQARDASVADEIFANVLQGLRLPESKS